MRGLLIAAALAIAASACATNAPTPARCAVEPGRAFDFWLGDWTIAQRIRAADGTWLEFPAHSSVSASPDGCVLTEHWTGAVQFFWEGMQAPETLNGYSVRVYDPAAGHWSIYWLDSRNPRFDTPYVGVFEHGRGEFHRSFETPQGPRQGRIVFSGVSATTVEWALDVSADAGVTWTPLWTMSMRRARPD